MVLPLMLYGASILLGTSILASRLAYEGCLFHCSSCNSFIRIDIDKKLMDQLIGVNAMSPGSMKSPRQIDFLASCGVGEIRMKMPSNAFSLGKLITPNGWLHSLSLIP